MTAPATDPVAGRDWSDYTPHDARVLADPYPAYRWLRHHAPVHYIAAEDIWAISRYDDVTAAAQDHRTFSQRWGVGYGKGPAAAGAGERPVAAGLALTNIDPPDHTRKRRLLASWFTPRRVREVYHDGLVRLMDELLDHALQRGRVNMAEEVAAPFLSRYVGDLVGVPREDLPGIKDGATAASLIMSANYDDGLLPQVRWFAEYWERFITAREAAIAAGERDPLAPVDITDAMFAPCPDGYVLNHGELVAYAGLIAVGGNETTAQLLAWTAWLLAERPDLHRTIHEDRSRIPAMVEEILRYFSPVQGMFRSVHEDITFAGTAIPANSKVLLLLASANHDETHYPNPEEFVLDRFPRGFVDADHVAFQAGIHTCLGAPLAREFIAVYLDRLAERVAEVRQVGPMKRSINALVKCVEDLPVELVPR